MTLEHRVRDLERANPSFAARRTIWEVVTPGQRQCNATVCTTGAQIWHRAMDESYEQFIARVSAGSTGWLVMDGAIDVDP